MGKLIKMDLRRMTKSTFFKISLAVIAVFNIIAGIALPLIVNLIPNASQSFEATPLSSVISNPITISLLIILLFVSVVSFTYADFANGYVKNLAGQVSKRSNYIFSKFVVIAIMNLIFVVTGALSKVIGELAGTAFGGKIEVDGLILAGIATLVIKWMLCVAISTILLFITTGVRNKTLASIVGVVIGTGALGLVYFGLDSAISGIFKVSDFSIASYMPDQLMNTVNVGTNMAVVNAIIVAVVCTALFLALSVKTFNSRDVK